MQPACCQLCLPPPPLPASPCLSLPCPPGHAYAAVISACAAGGQWQKAVALFDEMLAWGVRPDVVSCTALITGACAAAVMPGWLASL
jgi:pentatricopeptide repeat protein